MALTKRDYDKGIDRLIRQLQCLVGGGGGAAHPYTLEWHEVCVDGNTWIEIRVFDTTGGGAVQTHIFYIDNNGAIQPSAPSNPTPGRCVEQYIKLDDVCMDVGGVPDFVIPILRVVNGQIQGMFYVDKYGDLVTDPVAQTTDCCDCPACGGGGGGTVNVSACFQAFDGFSVSSLTPGVFQQFEIYLDGIIQTTLVVDYLATYDGTNKSTWYADVYNYINTNIPGWTMSVVNDVLGSNWGKVTWNMSYNGAAPSQLTIIYNGMGDIYTFDVDAGGNYTITITDAGNNPFATDPLVPCP